jgi:osmotically-inducible protein OsmY
MVRTLLRLIVIVIVVVAIAAFFFGYRWGGSRAVVSERPVGTAGSTGRIDTERARETGAEIGEKVAVGADRAQQALEAAGLTAKIKSKMALDDTVDAGRINVDTDGHVVTLSGSVDTETARNRALQLARETEGVTSVVDKLRVDR